MKKDLMKPNKWPLLAIAGLIALGLGAYALSSGNLLKDGQARVDKTLKTDSIVFFHQLEATDDKGQCNGKEKTTVKAALGKWTDAVKLDTDNREGGCYQKFGIYDPDNQLANTKISVNFVKEKNTDGQCEKTGKRIIPITDKLVGSNPSKWSSAYLIDTDERYGACTQTFSLISKDNIVLDIKFDAENDEGQCGNAGTHTVKPGKTVSLRLDMDGRSGGCYEQFRLRKL